MAHKIPKFSELPLDKSGPHHNAWGLYGKDDQLGTLNRLTDDIVKAASSEIQTGIRIGLDWPLDAQKDIPLFGRQAFHKEVYQKTPRIVNDDVWTFNTQSSTQWDGFRHCQCPQSQQQQIVPKANTHLQSATKKKPSSTTTPPSTKSTAPTVPRKQTPSASAPGPPAA
ncbi:hypothetical protein LTR91_007202 [Friedmanniomyces endolithicus]|uniref:Uncharacterized protein n=1 Tax=Friedmanniomyces endolithicus TaxID=329885 RepID=A0AAN6QVS8_9PEZI|nr:hypothetical protein LTR94_006155 [Friedmanniomyces endolithicus]KAK0802574.1 hypothetical protein LTR59_005013 [Friedmanniomyces endolithicus]KAK0812820.1 hypothetical protein LTR75_004767 [Friedmanniomyces endolithicus]KAK0818843.1 hypothetical protein LTR38_000942 [Friedmanniomyces endolithicus]KAK0855406.1 hypothetical protein LTR03_001857 [Friedmanniomyces endolithicus]